MRIGRTWVVAIGAVVALAAMESAEGRGRQTIIRGSVVFKGDPAKYPQKEVDCSKDPACTKEGKQIRTENVILNEATDPPTIRNVLVSIQAGMEKRAFMVPEQPVTLIQQDCQFRPHVVGVVAGQELRILNADDTERHIRFVTHSNGKHEFTQPKKDLEKGKQFKLEAEAPFKIVSETHPWMSCYVGVFNNMFFGVTGKTGMYEFRGMPAGTYTLEAWHETFGTLTKEVTIKKGETTVVDFVFEPGK